MMDEQILINTFARESFRNLADQDYISARISYINEFDQQFRWCALQAIEKYLKAILLFNKKTAKGLSHNLRKALTRIKGINDFPFTLHEDVENFIFFLSDNGADRYLCQTNYLMHDSLLKLDKTVWQVRRFCDFMRVAIPSENGEKDLSEFYYTRANSPEVEKRPNKFRIPGGYLEMVIENRLPSYKFLVWKNFFFGRVTKHKVKNFVSRSSSQNPTHKLHPEAFAILQEYVDFPKEVKEIFQQRN